MPTVRTIAARLEEFAPRSLAADWDNVGLLLGEPDRPVERLLTCLTVTPDVVAEAVATSCAMIVSHHPILLRGTKNLSSDAPEGRLLLPLLKAGIAVYSPHTAFDNTAGGINDMLAGLLGATKLRALRPRPQPGTVKFVVFVPEADLQKVSAAMFAAGAGELGAYSHCSYRLFGTGTFRPSAAANPTIGSAGVLEEVAEWRLEMICPMNRVEAVTAAMRSAHSYEEPAFDIYPMHAVASAIVGDGRVGDLPEPTPTAELARRLMTHLGVRATVQVGSADRLVRRLAVACGAAGEFLADALRAQCDLFVTGELRFHDALTARERGIAVLVPGHYATERFAVERLATMLQEWFPDLHAASSSVEKDPCQWVTRCETE